MAWWKLEWIKLKRKKTQKYFFRKKALSSLENAITKDGEAVTAEENRASDDCQNISIEALEISRMSLISESERGMLLPAACGLINFASHELVITTRGSDLETQQQQNQSPHLWPASWRVTGTRFHVKSYGSAHAVASKELRLLLEVRHPGLLYLMGVSFTSGSGLHLVFEHVTLGSLHHLLHVQREDVSLEEACRMMVTLCQVLRFLHHRHWLHLGLSSHAVQLTARGQAKLSSFELAKRHSEQGWCLMEPEDTQFQERIINWQAPEQCLGEPVGPETDVYSLTLLLQELITGEVPWGCKVRKRSRPIHSRSGTFFQSPSTQALLKRGLQVQRSLRTLSLQNIEELCNSHVGTSSMCERAGPIFEMSEQPLETVMPKKPEKRKHKLLSIGTFKRHLSNCQTCTHNTASPDPLRKWHTLQDKLQRSRRQDAEESPEEIYFDDEFAAVNKLGTHLQLQHQECCF